MGQVSVHEARNRLSQLIKDAQAGEDFNAAVREPGSRLWSEWRHRLSREARAIRSAVARSRMIHTGAVIRRRVVAHGLVQGVFFRDTCRRQAWAQRVSGWVTNREDGAVEAVFEGEPSAVQAMVEWAQKGPPHAYVSKLEVIEEEPRGERGFSVR